MLRLVRCAISRNHFRDKLFVLSLLLVTSTLLIVSCGPSGPPKITISPLTISPSSIVSGQPVSIAVNLLSSEKKTVQDYPVSLKINDDIIETQQIEINAGETKTVTFNYTPAVAGSYRADVNGQTATFEAFMPASFTVGPVNFQPPSPVAGQEIRLSADIKNDGQLPGTYTAIFQVDGKVLGSEDLTIDGGQSASASASFSANTSGIYIVELGDKTKQIKVLNPARYEATSLIVAPGPVFTGDEVAVTASVTNTGDVAGTTSVPLKINGAAVDSQDVTLAPGASQEISYTVSRDTAGVYNLSVLDSNTTFTVTALKSYTGYFNFKINYPPDYSVNDDDPYTVSIRKSDNEIEVVLTDYVSVASTPRDYFDSIASGKKQQFPDWAYTGLTDITESGQTIGYSYDYTNTVDGVKWIGKGEVIKKGGLGFYAVFTTVQSEWEANKALAARCVSSFAPPIVGTGDYTSPQSGITLSIPGDWSVIDSGASQVSMIIFGSSQFPSMGGAIGYDPAGSGMTAQEYVNAVAQQAGTLAITVISKRAFQFTDASSGYEMTFTFNLNGQTLKNRLICTNINNRMYIITVSGLSTTIDSQSSAITALAKSFTVAEPGVAGIDKNETLFLLEGEVPTLDPALTEEPPDGIIGAIFSGLVRIDQDLKVVPDLAQSWEISPDGLTYTFHLRHDARFQDGRQVTAADVKYSWERACDPALKSSKAPYFLNDIVGAQDRLDGKAGGISGIKVVDDFTLEVTIDAPRQYFLQKLAQVVAYIVDKDNVAQGSAWYEQPNGTGPFKLKTWVKDNYIVLERSDNFYEGPAKLKNIVFKMFAGDPMQLYENGDIDITGVSTSNREKVMDKTNPLNKDLQTGTTACLGYIGLNVGKPPFDDAKVREAFALALDVNKLIDVSLKGSSERAAGYLPQSLPGFDGSLEPIPFDAARAKQLIGESKYGSVAGLPPITVDTLYGTTPLLQAIIGMWQQNLGVQVKVETISEMQTYFDRMRNDEFQVFSGWWGADFMDPQNFLDVLFQSQSPENAMGYSSPDVDAALAAAAAEPDEATRLQQYRDIEQMILADLPAIPLYRDSQSLVLVKPYVKGYTVRPISVNLWRDIYVVAH